MSAIDINGLRVNYTDTGSGAPVVFVPGLAGSGDWFRYQSSGLSDRFRVITYDLRRGRCTLEMLVDDLSRLLASLKVYSAAVVGHSLGGLVALQFALSFPDRCPALVLCSTTPAMPSLTDGELIYHLLPAETRFDGVFSRLWKRLFGYKQPTVDDSDPRSYLIRSMADLDRATLSRRLSILRDTDMTPALGEIAVPTLIVASSGDKPYILASSQLMDERIPDSSLEVIENADQFYFHTRHDLFNALLADYLTEKIARL